MRIVCQLPACPSGEQSCHRSGNPIRPKDAAGSRDDKGGHPVQAQEFFLGLYRMSSAEVRKQ